MTVEAPPGISTNGAAPAEDEVVVSLRRAVEQRQARVDALKAQLAEVEPDLKRHQKALALLLNEDPEPKASGRPRTARVHRELSDDRLPEFEQAVRAYAVDHEEFRQVEIRALMGARSSVTSVAFEALRQANVVRLARRKGNSKFFRLTPAALANNDAWLQEYSHE